MTFILLLIFAAVTYVSNLAFNGSNFSYLLGALSAGTALWFFAHRDEWAPDKTALKGRAYKRFVDRMFYAALSAMMAKIAKADGRVDASEIELAKAVFKNEGITGDDLRYCIGVFRVAKDDCYTINDYAQAFVNSGYRGSEICWVMYAMLWDMAAVDGEISSQELELLRRVVSALGLNNEAYNHFYNGYFSRNKSNSFDNKAKPKPESEIEKAYKLFGCDDSSTNEQLRKAYRRLCKMNHPDTLAASGLPDVMIKKANDMMIVINKAWELIKKDRGLK